MLSPEAFEGAAVKKKRKKFIKYVHQRQKGLEKGLEVGAQDNQASGEERKTDGCRTICQSTARYETFILAKRKLQAWHNTMRSTTLLTF